MENRNLVGHGLFRVRRFSGQCDKSLGDGIHTSRKWDVDWVQEERVLAVGPKEQCEVKSPDGGVSVNLTNSVCFAFSILFGHAATGGARLELNRWGSK